MGVIAMFLIARSKRASQHMPRWNELWHTHVLSENAFLRNHDAHGDAEDRMTLVSAVIIDCVIFNMYIGCEQHTFFSFEVCYTHHPHGKPSNTNQTLGVDAQKPCVDPPKPGVDPPKPGVGP